MQMVKTTDLVAAMRCSSQAPTSSPPCATCAYRVVESLDGKDYTSCDCDRMGMDAADRLEELVDRCARYAEEIAALRELAEADKDGRVVALPVKPVLAPIISSMLYIIEDGDIYEDALCEAVVGMSESGKTNVVYTTLSDQMIFEQADIGKTVFLTREKAKEALEAMRKEEAT